MIDLFDDGDPLKLPDALRKAQHLWRNRPVYFWGLSPTRGWYYGVRYGSVTFQLNPVDDVPAFVSA